MWKNLSIRNKVVFVIWLLCFTSVGIVVSLFSFFATPSNFHFLLLIPFIASITLFGLWITLLKNFIEPMEQIAQFADTVSKGDITQSLNIKGGGELGLIVSSLNKITADISQARFFTERIGAGKYDVAFDTTKLDEKNDALFHFLTGMREQLKAVSIEEGKRNWLTQGLAEFTEALRSDDIDLKELGNNIIKKLVDYVGAGQGGLFVLNNEKQEETFLELISCYAYDEIQYIQKKIIIQAKFGEGLVGQAFLERQLIHLTDLPKDYLQIVSGMGEAPAKAVLIVPLELNNKVEGVIELASFQDFDENHIELVKQLAENITSAVLTIKSNENTKKLLKEAQQLTVQIQTREEELKKNYEELKTTQELVEKNNALIESQKKAIEKALAEQEAKNDLLSVQEVEMRKRAKELESKNQLITASIQYAKNIQRAILPTEAHVREAVTDFFVVYMPKDIVSGDFYWFVNTEKYAFFAAVDCTGHGVPGAFMSIIGNTILNEIVNVKRIYEPSKILELLHTGVRTRLRQEEATNNDGMDLALCRVEKNRPEKTQVLFAGAKRTLYYLALQQNHTYTLEDLKELKGDRKSIGGWQHEDYRTFEQQEIVLKQGDYIFLMTDGLADAPDKNRKKFGTDRFKKIIIEKIYLTREEIRNAFLDAINTHQAGTEQRDDITVMGVKI